MIKIKNIGVAKITGTFRIFEILDSMWMHCVWPRRHILKVDEHCITDLSVENRPQEPLPFCLLNLLCIRVICILLVNRFLVFASDTMYAIQKKLGLTAVKFIFEIEWMVKY